MNGPMFLAYVKQCLVPTGQCLTSRAFEVTEPAIPIELRFGRERAPAPSRECMAEENAACPNFHPLADSEG
jgi:hypothetical protein